MTQRNGTQKGAATRPLAQRFGSTVPLTIAQEAAPMQRTTVINIRNAPTGWRTNPDYVYCGRANARYGVAYSDWYNPYPMKSESERDAVIEKFRAYLERRPDLRARVGELRGKTLVCWCAPKACHCDYLAELAEVQS